MPDGEGTAGGLEAEAAAEVARAKRIDSLEKELAATTDIRKQQELIHEILMEQAKAAGDIATQMKLMNVKEGAKAWDDIFAATTGISDAWKDSTAMKIWKGDTDALQKSFARTFTAANIAYSSISKISQASIKLAYDQDEAAAAFNRDTGAMRMYGDQMLQLEQNMFHHGVKLEDAAAAYGALIDEMGQFNNMSNTEQAELAETTALLEQMGVGAGTTAQNMNFLTAAMGMSASEAAASQREMFVLAQEIGMAPTKMAEGFNSARPHMAKFGAEGTAVYKKLAVNAKHAGMEVETLLSITEKFDTFEGAAQSVGQLNAILGGPFLSSMQMVEATDPTERMRLLSNAVNEAGASFDDMGYYERIALTEAMGLKDVSELALLMRDGFDETVPAMAQSQAELATLAEQSKEFNAIGEELTQMMRAFAISMSPVIKAMKSILQGIQDLNAYTGGVLIPGLGIAISVVAAFFALLTALGPAAAAVATVAAPALAAIGPASGGAAVGLAALTPAMTAAGAAMATAAPGFLGIGAAIFLIGAAIFLAAAGMALLVASFALLFHTLETEKLINFIGALNSLIMSMSMLVPLIPALGLLAYGLTGFAFAMSLIDTTNIAVLGSFFQSLSSALDKDIEKLVKMEEAIRGIVSAANAVDDTERLVAVRQIIEAVHGAAAARGGTPGGAGAGGPAGGALGRPLNVQMVMNGREMMSWSYNTVSDFLNYKD